MSTNIFEQASRLGLTFNTTKGLNVVTDLWQLPLESQQKISTLDSIWVECKKDLDAASTTISFVKKNKAIDITKQLRLDIVEHIINVKQAENIASATRRTNAAEKKLLLEALSKKQDGAREDLTVEELQTRINTL